MEERGRKSERKEEWIEGGGAQVEEEGRIGERALLVNLRGSKYERNEDRKK